MIALCMAPKPGKRFSRTKRAISGARSRSVMVTPAAAAICAHCELEGAEDAERSLPGIVGMKLPAAFDDEAKMLGPVVHAHATGLLATVSGHRIALRR